MGLPEDRICKTVRQHSKGPVSEEDMEKLLEIGADWRRVKNYVYQRYGGIRSLPKLYPGYTVQNEMTESGLRSRLNLPSVYFYLAVFDALGDIKIQWQKTKNGVLKAVKENGQLTEADRHYLRFVMKVSACFDSILNGKVPEVPERLEKQYKSLSGEVNTERLNRYLCRQVRKRLRPIHTEKAESFAVAERAYRYGESQGRKGIFLATKENRKRVFIPLTDDNTYKSQLYIRLFPEETRLEIHAAIKQRIRRHSDYDREIGLSMGIRCLFTTDSGAAYGRGFWELHQEKATFTAASFQTYQRERENNPGRKKYLDKKRRMDARMEAYVNQELNRLIREEKPAKIYVPRLPGNTKPGVNKTVNYSVTVWRRGYIRKRLAQKCLENGIELVEVLGKGIHLQCSRCKETGSCLQERFFCEHCGYEEDRKVNTARNALQRGRQGQTVNRSWTRQNETEKEDSKKSKKGS